MKIIAVKAELHIFSGEVNWARPLRLQICLADGGAFRLRIAGDGGGLVVERLPLEPPLDMGEYGRTGIFDFTDRLGPATTLEAIGEPLAIRNRAGLLIGLALPRTGGERFCIWVNGDEFRWGPEDALKEDYWPGGRPPALSGSLFD